MNMFDLTNKNAVVIGGGGGIGGAIAEGLAGQGACVAIVGRRAEKLNQKAAEINKSTGKELLCLPGDASNEDEVAAFGKQATEAFGRVHILVNSQGLNLKYPAFEHPMDEWDRIFDVNIRSVMLTCKFFGKHMAEKGGGKIINISSIGAVRTNPTDVSAAYGATKGAVNTLSLTLAAGWAKHKINVNCIAPIMTETEMMKEIFEQHPEIREKFGERIPLGRMAEATDCVGPALFFASAASDFVTGQIIYPDGGLTTLQ